MQSASLFGSQKPRQDSQTRRGFVFQMGIQPEKKRRKKDHTGEISLSSDWPIRYCPEKLFIFLVVHRDQWIKQKLCSVSSPDSYRDQAFSLHTQLYTQVLVDLHHLWPEGQLTFYSPFLIRDCQPENLKSVVLPTVWCHSQKALNKVTFLHNKDTTIYNKERGVQ